MHHNEESSDKRIQFTKRLLDRIEVKRKKKFDKSYALIEFYDYASKQKALITDVR